MSHAVDLAFAAKAGLGASPSLDETLLLEGWSLHQRLQAAAQQGLSEAAAQTTAALDTWRKLVGPDQQATVQKRLHWDDLSPASAAWAIHPPMEAIPRSPRWWPLLQALRNVGLLAAEASGPLAEPVAGLKERGACLPFVHVWRPAAAWALQTLQQRCLDLELRLQLSPVAWLDLAESLLSRLCNTTDQALWEQFNQRRTPGQMLMAHLGLNGDGSGDPVHEAYDAFIAEQFRSGYGLLLAEYPVLGRLLAVAIELWLEGSEEMLRRVASNRHALQEHFGVAESAPLAAIQLGLSDPHRGGRAVAILRFGDSDQSVRVVYKPKDMQVDQSYQDFLQMLNEGSALPPLRRLTVLCFDGYGFMEWVKHRPCTNDAALAHFYRNAGRTMAVLHLLGCSDCQYENLIASGDQLLLIDTEALLKADLSDLNSDQPEAGIAELQRSFQGSVLCSGLLPHWVVPSAGEKRFVDNSALGIQPPPLEREQPTWLGLNSDAMRAGRCRQSCDLPTSLPVGLGMQQRLTDFIDDLCAGFEEQLMEMMQLRHHLLPAMEHFAGQPQRVLARATPVYVTIQRQMLQPASLRSAVTHGLKLEQLSRSYVVANDKPLNWPLLHAEILQMERFDIPFFARPIDGDVLPLPEGLASIPGFKKTCALAAAWHRLSTLDQREISVQQQLIRGAIAVRRLNSGASDSDGDQEEAKGSEEQSQSTALLANADYSQEAWRLCDELWSDSIRDREGRPQWLGLEFGADGKSFHLDLIGASLYSGRSGIAVLFARAVQAARAKGDQALAQQWRQRAWATVDNLAEQAASNGDELFFRFLRDLPCGLAGAGGLLLALGLLQDAGLTDAGPLAHLLMEQLRPERLLADEGIDVIAGVTGLIGPLLTMNTGRSLELAVRCGERLLATQHASGGWLLQAGASSPHPALTGFSHGAAGMAAALAQLFSRTGDHRFADAARRAIAYERSVFVADRGNWPDFRSSAQPDAFMLSWCHGAPGILLSRLALKRAGLADDTLAAELTIARSSTLAAVERLSIYGGTPTAHLCCGVLGLTSLLRIDSAERKLPLEESVLLAESLAIRHAQASGGYAYFSVDQGSLNLPGLFTGKAGVALALLEAAEGQLWMIQVLSAGLLVTA